MPQETPSTKSNRSDASILLADPKKVAEGVGWAYSQLVSMATGLLRDERQCGSWHPTSLANEASLRLLQNGNGYKNRAHFFGAAARTMRRILVDAARRRNAGKRGGGWYRVDFGYAERLGFEQPDQLLRFDLALKQLAAVEPLWSDVAELRVFGGFSTPEIAHALDIGNSTARRRWALARRWLRDRLLESH